MNRTLPRGGRRRRNADPIRTPRCGRAVSSARRLVGGTANDPRSVGKASDESACYTGIANTGFLHDCQRTA